MDENETASTSGPTIPDIQFAGFGIRLLAYVIDILVLMVFVIFGMFAKSVTAYLLVLVPMILYKPVMEGLLGGTAGKLALGLRVVNEDGERIGVVGGFVRAGIFLLPIIPNTLIQTGMMEQGISPMDAEGGQAFRQGNGLLFAAYYALSLMALLSCLAVLFSKQKQGLHDRIAGTWVIREKSAS